MSARTLTFTVVGLAQTQGSTRAFIPKGWKRPVITNDNPKNKGWRQTIAHVAAIELQRAEHAGRFFAGPVELEVVFYLPRPKALLTKKLAGVDVPHTKKPDADKLARSCKDALSKVIWHDDSQVTDLIARKRYCRPDEHPRAVITVREANPMHSLLEAS
jgi:Holliday junction resolvase RusA-like endonuclease